MTLPAFQKGVYPFFDAVDLDPNTLTINANAASSMSSLLVDGIGVTIYGSDLWQNETDGETEAVAWFGRMLDQVDAHLASVGRSPKPIWIRLVPAALPPWVIAAGLTNPNTPTHQRDLIRGIDVVSIKNPTLGHSQSHMPYSHTTAYQSYIRILRGWLATALDTHDPAGTRVPVLHWFGPFSQSKQMGIPSPVGSFPNDGSPDPVWQTGAFASDPIGNAWTYPKHLAAMQLLAGEMGSIPAFADRWWFFTFTSSTCFVSDQAAVWQTLKAQHPDGPEAVLPKQENFGVGVINVSTQLFTNIQRQVMRANAGGNSSAAADWFVNQQQPHGWEAFSPFTFKNNAGLSNTYKGVLTPNLDGTPGSALDFSEWLQNMFFKTFTADIRGKCSDHVRPWWFEPFAADTQALTLTNYPAWAQALATARGLIQGTITPARVNLSGGGRFARIDKGVLA